jgi:dipeptidase
MCDTFVVVKPGHVLFGKNSDRDPNEAQVLSWVPEQTHPPGAKLQCTWSSIDQVEHTYATLLCRPFWMWGAEIGVNEHGVVIGNEAIFARAPLEEDGLLGMDLVRLGLERGNTAEAAKNVVCELIERHGQGGRCSYEKAGFSYHNSFLIADASGAWVVEAAGRRVATKHISDGVYAISNSISLPELKSRSDNIDSSLRSSPLWGAFGVCRRALRASARTWVASASKRRSRVQCLAREVSDVQSAMDVLRDHGSENSLPRYLRHNGAMSAPCMHAGGWLAASQTVCSLVSELTPTGQQHWATGTAAPCLSVFRPVSAHQARDVGTPTGTPDDNLWWRSEFVHRALLSAEHSIREQYLADRELTQKHMLEVAADDAWLIADDWLSGWQDKLQLPTATDPRPKFLQRYWRRIETQAAAGSLLPWRGP